MTTPNIPMSESGFQTAVLELATRLGWRTMHVRPAQNRAGRWRTPVAGDGAGFPDLVLVRGQHLIFVELKTNTGRASTEQERWLDALTTVSNATQASDGRSTHVTATIWRPREWDDIVHTLRTLGVPNARQEP